MLHTKVEVKNLVKVFYNQFGDTLRSEFFGNSSKKISLSPQDKLVLDHISFNFNAGETIGIIGRNGAGKSTLLSILAGISQKTRGEINICGKVTAVMTLGLGLRDDLSGRENIYLDGELLGKNRKEIDQDIEEIIAFTELGPFIDKPVKIYSTGMKSRLAFSMLVGLEPEILIIDEALSAGDAFFAVKAAEKIKEICQKGKIVIIVSHSMSSIQSMCNRCLWLEKGSIVMDGDPLTVTKQYLQKIREEDTAADLKNFKKTLIQIHNNAHYKIDDVGMRRINNGDQQTIFYTNDSLNIDIKILKIKESAATLHVLIQRIDGLIVSHDQYDIQEYGLAVSSHNRQENHSNDVPRLVRGIQGSSSDIGSLDTADKPRYIGRSNLPGDCDKIRLADSHSFFVLQLSLDPLVLNQGYYQLQLKIEENKTMTNQFSRLFEVKNDNMSKGGVSLLHYPATIMSHNEAG